ncbi:MAG TPA: protocatechuate 3,4-dioxygenase [Xanthomonadaceae bacterium]|nr:protocatechuate 3,4-dioxygenase [Xanthomonadaceae bacterium]
MADHPALSRRRLLAFGAGAASLALTLPRGAAAQACLATPRQTMGPFFPVGEHPETDVDLTRLAGHSARAQGQIIHVQGRVLDPDCAPVEGALVDLWQANAHGRYAHPADTSKAPLDPDFQGWGQIATDAQGRYSFTTIKPAAYALDPRADRPVYRTPHLHFRVARRGFVELSTQMYFAGEALNETDGILRRIDAAARERVIIAAGPQDAGLEGPLFRFDITVQPA